MWEWAHEYTWRWRPGWKLTRMKISPISKTHRSSVLLKSWPLHARMHNTCYAQSLYVQICSCTMLHTPVTNASWLLWQIKYKQRNPEVQKCKNTKIQKYSCSEWHLQIQPKYHPSCQHFLQGTLLYVPFCCPFQKCCFLRISHIKCWGFFSALYFSQHSLYFVFVFVFSYHERYWPESLEGFLIWHFLQKTTFAICAAVPPKITERKSFELSAQCSCNPPGPGHSKFQEFDSTS